jgi:hypothetical protein
VTLKGRCIGVTETGGELVDEGDRASEYIYKYFVLDTKWNVVKVIETFISYARLKEFTVIPIRDNLHAGIQKLIVVFLETEVCRDNSISRMVRKTHANTFPDIEYTDGEAEENPFVGPQVPGYGEAPVYFGSPSFMTAKTVSYGEPIIEKDTEIQGTLGPNNTIRFSRAMYNYWPNGVSINSNQITVTPGININQQYGVPNYFWRNTLVRKCASLKADVLIETSPIKVEVTVAGSASGISKTLRVVNTSFRYSEDPDNPIDDTSKMTQYAEDLLQKYKDIKVNGSITLDTIDLDWDLDKTVNLINTDQASWSSISAKVIGIRYDFDANTTILEITSEYLK